MSFLELLSLLERHGAVLNITSSPIGFMVRISNRKLVASRFFSDGHITKINGNASEVLIGEICEMIKQLEEGLK